MTDDLNGGPAEEQDGEAGEPVSILEELDQETSPRFLERVRHRIDRRVLSSHVMSLTWQVPMVVVLELLKFIFDFIPSNKEQGGGSR